MHPRTTTSSIDKSESIAESKESRVSEADVYKTCENEAECYKHNGHEASQRSHPRQHECRTSI
jgi:hypothetical protein